MVPAHSQKLQHLLKHVQMLEGVHGALVTTS